MLLSSMSGGINRFEQEARRNQLVSGIDVIYKDGDLRRRPAWSTVQLSAPFLMPAGLVTLKTRLGGSGGYTNHADRNPTISSFNEFFIGCDYQFDGIDWRYVTRSGFSSANKSFLEISYSTGADTWTVANRLSWRDWTRYREGKTAYAQPLSRDGRIAWHKSLFTNWGSYAFDGSNKFWIRLRIVDRSSALTTLAATVTMNAPGVRVFQLSPVNFIDYRTFRGGREALLFGSDRQNHQIYEQGACLARVPWDGIPAEELFVVEDEGSGVIGVTTWPQWQQYVASVWTDQGAPGTPSYGTANRVTKNLTKTLKNGLYDWHSQTTSEPISTQHRGGPLRTSLAPNAAPSSNQVQFADLSVPDGYYRGCRLRVTAKGAGGTPVGEEREIFDTLTSGGNTKLYYYDAFSTTPDTDNRFAVISPHSELRTKTSDRKYEISSNTAHTATLLTSRPYAASAIESGINNLPCNFEIGKITRYSTPAGKRWSTAYSPETNELFLANGKTNLLSFDGRRLRKVIPDTTSELAKLLSGQLPDKPKDEKDPANIAKALLGTKIKIGKYVTDWNGHIAVGGFDAEPNNVQWSMPSGASRIWPLLYNQKVRDDRNLPISGIGSLGGQPVVWTPASIHVGTFGEYGDIAFRPNGSGLGFINHHGVAKCTYNGNTVLMGPNADGIYAWTGQEPIPVLDRWDRIIEGGVNIRALHLSVGCYMVTENWYCLAVPRRASDELDRLVIFDTTRGSFWVWTLPFGCSSIGTIFDQRGYERLLVGTNDGHVMALVDAETDDGNSISSTARSAPFSPGGDISVSATALMVTAQALSTSQTMDVSLFMQKRPNAWQSADLKVDDGAPEFTTVGGSTPAFGAASYADRSFKTARLSCKLGSVAKMFQVEIGGTARWALRELSLEYSPRARR